MDCSVWRSLSFDRPVDAEQGLKYRLGDAASDPSEAFYDVVVNVRSVLGAEIVVGSTLMSIFDP